MKHPVSVRLIKAYDHLKDRGIVTSQKEFAIACGFSDTHFNELRDGVRNTNLSVITNLYIKFGVSLTYLVIGKPPIMDKDAKKEIAPELARQLEEERDKVRTLEREREQLLKLLAFYQEELKEKLK
ncbi:hypothetical protein C8N40_11159 [Pontibacter mucosus]|uniref:Uncharacterized protein n=1 Tax=Pontibacter mucosus TaxID=1649266 RepID=A0A2T5YD12_9BACT|nr:hypothetical protein [Pontibacter mucosus]PTX14394.1 hypothetical protein C8N40_11159 [Pontibacter mucosus]